MLVTDNKDWDKDPRPPNWGFLGWSVTVKRPGSPLRDTADVKKYTSLRWDHKGHSVARITVTPKPEQTPSTTTDNTQNPPQAHPRMSVSTNNEGAFLPVGKKGRHYLKRINKKPLSYSVGQCLKN